MSANAPGRERILVIKLSALGDFVLALGPFQAIRRHHGGAHVTLLTTAPFAALAEHSGWFDAIWIDARPPAWRLDRWLAQARRLRQGAFRRVYDLQTSDRSSWYFHLLADPKPEWSGVARGCSHPHRNPDRDRLHALDAKIEQLAVAGIASVPPPDLGWLAGDIAGFHLPGRSFALLVPGGAAHRPEKRWPAQHYAALARHFAAAGLVPVVLGAAAEAAAAAVITDACPEARSLVGATTFADIAALATAARVAVGNDTGPMHLIAAAGTPSLVLFSQASDPALSAPRGPAVVTLRHPDLARLDSAAVIAALPPPRRD
ncbi:MAG: ADP-heptose--LPS heptosyltransferase [Alphaproteobacteria bacterium]|nr:ADP-heptose--LPS heptosyltransferase [Alphaproteobacteria bacterium]